MFRINLWVPVVGFFHPYTRSRKVASAERKWGERINFGHSLDRFIRGCGVCFLIVVFSCFGKLLAQTDPVHNFVTIPATNCIQTDLISTFPTGIFTTQNGLAIPFSIPSAHDTCGVTGNGACNFYDGFGFTGGGQQIMISAESIPNVRHVYTLMNAYTPALGQQLATIEFVGSMGASQTFPLVAGENIRDFYQGGYANTLNNGIPHSVALNAFTCIDPANCLGAGGTGNVQTGLAGTYVVDVQEFFLGPKFASQDLVQIIITDTYNGSNPILLGITADTGTIVGPNATLSTSSLTFATQLVGTTSPAQAVTLINNGSQTLQLNGGDVMGHFRQTNNCGVNLPPGGVCTINVTFTPAKRGTQIGTISIIDNAPNSPQTVNLTGVGSVVELNPNSLNFGVVAIGQSSSPLQTTLTNLGNVPLSITNIAITGADPEDFSQQNTCGQGIGGGQSCTITVTFKPTQSGGRNAEISISDNGGGSPQLVSLNGTGGLSCGGRCTSNAQCRPGCSCIRFVCRGARSDLLLELPFEPAPESYVACTQ